MANSHRDFGNPTSKTVGCFVLILSPLFFTLAHAFSMHPVPFSAFAGAFVSALTGLGFLCNRKLPVASVLRTMARVAPKHKI